MRRQAGLAAALLTLLALLVPATAHGHGGGAPTPAPPGGPFATAAGVPDSCPGDPIAADQVITGDFEAERQGSYVLVPFAVPAGTTAVRVKYCHDQPEAPTSAQLRHTLDLGIYDPRRGAGRLWGVDEFRGWGGSSHPDVTVSREGFSSEAEYRAEPKGHVPGRTTRGFEPGPVPAGDWAVELGLASIIGRSGGDADDRVAWRVEIELSSDPRFADEPYRPAPYDARPARRAPGWYAGDLHVHAEHSALGDATMTETFGYAFGPREQGGAGLDFITLSDYVVGSHWDEIGRHQGAHPGKLIMRSAEVITYRGHANNHASTRTLDYRTGPVLERRPDGRLEPLRGPRPPSELFDAVHAAGGFTQINHPTIFPSAVPLFASLCRGCPWDYTDAETQYEKVDAWEVHTGPPGNDGGSNPFTLTAIAEWDALRRRGFDLAAVAVSDSHNAGRTPNAVTQAPIGVGTTVVYADELSEDGIRRGVRAGHAYVKLFGAGGPDLRLEARAGERQAIMGDALPETRADFEAKVLGGADRRLLVIKDGSTVEAVPVTGDDFTHRFTGDGKGDYRLQLERGGGAVEALTNPIRLGAPAAAPEPDRPAGGGSPAGPGAIARRPRIRMAVAPRRVRAGERVRFRVRAWYRDARGRRRAVRRATVRLGGARVRTGRRGRVVFHRRLRAPGRYRARVTRRGFRPATRLVRAR